MIKLLCTKRCALGSDIFWIIKQILVCTGWRNFLEISKFCQCFSPISSKKEAIQVMNICKKIFYEPTKVEKFCATTIGFRDCLCTKLCTKEIPVQWIIQCISFSFNIQGAMSLRIFLAKLTRFSISGRYNLINRSRP